MKKSKQSFSKKTNPEKYFLESRIILDFTLSQTAKIEISLPKNHKQKFNYYYKPRKELDKFDEVTVNLFNDGFCIKLFEDMATESITIGGQLESAVEGLIDLPSKIDVGSLIYARNEDGYAETLQLSSPFQDINFSNFSVWSRPRGPQTFMYTRDGNTYLEIGRIYPWIYSDPEPLEPDYIPYETFIAHYRPILVTTISKSQASALIKKCQDLDAEMEATHLLNRSKK
jgi:hypothetical protein